RIAEDHARITHGGRADDQKIDIAAAFEDGGARRGAQLVLLHPRARPRQHRPHRVRAQLAGPADAVELLRAVNRYQLVQKAAREHQLCVGKPLAQHIVMVDRQIVGMTRIDLHEPDATAFELELADALDHYLGIAPVAAVAHVVYRDLDLPPYRFRVRPAHGIDERGLAFERNEHVAGKRVPFPMPGEPEHARAKAPVTGAAWHDHYIEPVLGHFRAQSAIAAL